MLCHTQSWIIPGGPEMACSGNHFQVSEATNQVVYRVFFDTINNLTKWHTKIRYKADSWHTKSSTGRSLLQE